MIDGQDSAHLSIHSPVCIFVADVNVAQVAEEDTEFADCMYI